MGHRVTDPERGLLMNKSTRVTDSPTNSFDPGHSGDHLESF